MEGLVDNLNRMIVDTFSHIKINYESVDATVSALYCLDHTAIISLIGTVFFQTHRFQILLITYHRFFITKIQRKVSSTVLYSR